MTEAQPARVVLVWSAIWRAALSMISVALPLSLLQKWLVVSDRIDGSDAVNYLLYLVIMLTGALAGFAAAKLTPYSPLQNGAAAAAVGALAIQVGGAVRQLIIGDDISSPISWLFLALLLATFGMGGAWVHTKTHSPAATGASR